MSNKRQMLFLKALTLVNASHKGLILPFLPLFLSFRGFSSVEIGTILGIAPMVSIVAQPFLVTLVISIKRLKGYCYFYILP